MLNDPQEKEQTSHKQDDIEIKLPAVEKEVSADDSQANLVENVPVDINLEAEVFNE